MFISPPVRLKGFFLQSYATRTQGQEVEARFLSLNLTDGKNSIFSAKVFL
jgi:hypothetical protein